MDTRLFDQLVCPVTKGPLIFRKASAGDTGTPSLNDELISLSARLAYPFKDGIPVLMETEARVLTEDEYEKLREAHPARV